MTTDIAPSFDEALTWAARVQDPAFGDWDAHIAWLSAHPGNPGRYHDAVLALEAGLDSVFAPMRESAASAVAPTASNDDERRSARRGARGWRWATGAAMGLAACIAGLVGMSHTERPQDILLRGVARQAKSFRLPDGSVVALNGGSVLRFASGERRTALLDRGEAFIRVAHDPAHPFELHAGDKIFRDIGTAFDVSRLGDTVTLAVAEGAVAFDPDGTNIPVMAGREIRVHGGEAILSNVSVGSVGTWRSGRLVFRNAPLGDLAHDLSLALGESVDLDDGLGGRRFSGVITLADNPEKVVDQVGLITGLRTRPTGKGWLITAVPAIADDPHDRDRHPRP